MRIVEMRALIAALLPLSAPAAASPPSSSYTKHDFTACRQAANDGVVETRVCAGHGGIPVRWFGEPDGTSISFGGKDAADGLGRDFAFVGSTIEWRGPMRGGTVVPVAAIVRVDLSQGISGPVTHRLLVVHKLRGNAASCIAAVVDAGAPGANERARKVADEIAPGFRCGVDTRKGI